VGHDGQESYRRATRRLIAKSENFSNDSIILQNDKKNKTNSPVMDYLLYYMGYHFVGWPQR
jgi:hypothetical protein